MTASALALSESQLFQKVHFYINFNPHNDIGKEEFTPPPPKKKEREKKPSKSLYVKSEHFCC